MEHKFTILYLWLLMAKLCLNSCGVNTSLTLTEEQRISEFISAKQITSSDQANLVKAYQSLTNIGEYIVQLDSGYDFDVASVQDCTQIPSYITFNAFNDIWTCLKNKIITLNCNKEWEMNINCGTFLQLHLPFNQQALSYRSIDSSQVQSAINLSILNTCAGTHHIWFVYITRVGKVIRSVKPIFISYPGCICN